jgi:serine/threonine protein phosphatase PrpC
VITRAVGGIVDEELELEVRYQELRAGDRFLLCSDGLYKELGDDEIAARLSAGDVGRVARSLLDEALERAGRDNITVIVVELEPD